MRIFAWKEKGITLFASEDIYQEFDSDFLSREDNILEYCINLLEKYFEGLYQEYIKKFSELKKGKNEKKIAILLAHGEENKKKWTYADGKNVNLVQGWINKQDGKYACLMIICCNPESLTVFSKKSLLVIPDRIVGELRPHIFSLIHPKKGEISGYIVQYELDQLEKEAQKCSVVREKG